MANTLETIRRLEEYIEASGSSTDAVMDMTLNKLLSREIRRLTGVRSELIGQIQEFESEYGYSSREFSQQFESGELGDAVDFVEWSATLDMITNIDRRLAILGYDG